MSFRSTDNLSLERTPYEARRAEGICMENTLAHTVRKYRKENDLTQKEMAEALGVTFQTVSKWERGEMYPDIMLLPKIAALFGVSVDTLLGYFPGERQRTVYAELYKQDEYFWGMEPTDFCYQILAKYPPVRYMRLLEIGCGEGRDAVFFARNGYDVTAFDIVPDGIRKTQLLASKFGVPLTLFCEDMFSFTPKEEYDVVYASRVFQYLPPENREEFFSVYKKCTKAGGLHAFLVFVEKPFIPAAPDSEPNVHLMRSGEILTYYYDWNFLSFEEKVIDCNSSGVPHRHCVNLMMAVKPE